MPVRGIRGAVQALSDTPEAVLLSTRQLLQALVEANPGIHQEDIASIFFTVTGDLRSAYPAQAAREMGLVSVPLMCAQEIPVPGSLPRCIRILIHWNTQLSQESIQPIYLGAAAGLRPEFGRELEESNQDPDNQNRRQP
jgi:chorismate mutase